MQKENKEVVEKAETKPVNVMVEEARADMVGAMAQVMQKHQLPASIMKLVVSDIYRNILDMLQQQINSDLMAYEQEAKDGTE